MSNKVSQVDVLAWLQQNHPELHKVAELDRAWVWLPVNLKGDQHKPVRESIKLFGFRFSFKGHALPSGKQGTWAHHCTVPIPYKKGGKGKDGGHRFKNAGKANSGSRRSEERQSHDALDSKIESLLQEIGV